jgi:hypothetical protein
VTSAFVEAELHVAIVTQSEAKSLARTPSTIVAVMHVRAG